MKLRPLIGITISFQPSSETRPFARFSDIVYSDCDYALRVEKAGGLPFLLPYYRDENSLGDLVQMLDGLLLTGGEDIHPRRYGQEVMDGVCIISELRDDFEFKLTERFLKTGKPVLAICRGIQLINVIFKGTLIQDLPAQAAITHHMQTPPFHTPVHSVCLQKNTRLNRAGSEAILPVNSTHHQAIDRLGNDLTAVAWSEEGIIEAIEFESYPYFVGVQWHPERLGNHDPRHQKIFDDFVQAASTQS